MRSAAVGALLIFTCGAQVLTFEAASVKPAAAPKGMIPMPRTDPGRVRYPYINLKYLLMAAYDVKVFQVAGPGWLDTERFEVDAIMAPIQGAVPLMLRNLLAERFQLGGPQGVEGWFRPTYALVVGRNGGAG